MAIHQSLCVRGGVAVLEEGPRPLDILVAPGGLELLDPGTAAGGSVIDASGCWVFPGLINGHDHLDFGGLRRRRPRTRYADYREWAADLHRGWRGLRLRTTWRRRRARRCVQAAWLNRRAGVTTVAHHNPIEPWMPSERFPLRIVERMGWYHSHSFGAGGARRSLESTPPDWPWVIHVGEGTSDRCRWELDFLEAEGCLGPRTVVVHGLALRTKELERLAVAGAALVWCPTSNLYLYGQTLNPRSFPPELRVALGTDSALTAAGGLLDELRTARQLGAEPDQLLSMVTIAAASIYRLGQRFGRLAAGAAPDLVVAPKRSDDPAADLCTYQPRDLRAVICRAGV